MLQSLNLFSASVRALSRRLMQWETQRILTFPKGVCILAPTAAKLGRTVMVAAETSEPASLRSPVIFSCCTQAGATIPSHTSGWKRQAWSQQSGHELCSAQSLCRDYWDWLNLGHMTRLALPHNPSPPPIFSTEEGGRRHLKEDFHIELYFTQNDTILPRFQFALQKSLVLVVVFYDL